VNIKIFTDTNRAAQ